MPQMIMVILALLLVDQLLRLAMPLANWISVMGHTNYHTELAISS